MEASTSTGQPAPAGTPATATGDSAAAPDGAAPAAPAAAPGASGEQEGAGADAAKPEGKADLGEGVGLVSDLLVHFLVEEEAERLADKVAAELSQGDRVLLVTDRGLVADEWSHRLVGDGLAAFKRVLEAASAALSSAREALSRPPEMEALQADEAPPAGGETPPAPEAKAPATLAVPGIGAGLEAASQLVGGFADLVGYLRADYSVTARQVTVGETPLLAAFAGRLVQRHKAVDVDGFTLLDGSPVFDAYRELVEMRHRVKAAAKQLAEEAVEPVKRQREAGLETLKALVPAVAKAIEAKPEEADAIWQKLVPRLESLWEGAVRTSVPRSEAAAAVASAEEAVSGFDGFAGAIVAAPSGGGYPPLFRAALRQRLHADRNRCSHVLYLNLEATGGEVIKKTWLWSDPQLRYLGGGQLSYLLYSAKEHELVKAGTVSLLGSTKFGFDGGGGAVQVARLHRAQRHRPRRPWGFPALRRLAEREG